LGQSLDLNQIFAPIPIPVTYTQTGATVSSSSTYNTILTFDGSYGTFQIISNTNVQIYSEVVGPGGYGGDSFLDIFSSYVNGGGGGGGGGITTNTTMFNPNILYTITVGQPSANSSSTGSASSIIGGIIDISANSGYNGNSATESGTGTGGNSGGGGSGSGGDGGFGGGGGFPETNPYTGNPGGSSSNNNYGGGGGGGGGAVLEKNANGGTGGSPFGGNGGTPNQGVTGRGYGGGGGGGGGYADGLTISIKNPGQGYQGVVVLYFNV
jgi:hypothetical protein